MSKLAPRRNDAAREAAEILTAPGGTVGQAEPLVFLAEKGFEHGVKTHLEVQDADLNLLLAKGNFARGEGDYRVARVTVEWVSGAGGHPSANVRVP